MGDRIRVGVVDDHPLFRGGVSHTIASAPDMELVGEGATAQDALWLCTRLSPEIILLDLTMPGGGLKAAEQIHLQCSAVKTVILTVSESEADVVACLRAGVSGYMLKGSSGSELLQILRLVYRSELYVAPALAARLLARNREQSGAPGPDRRLERLTHRERQVLHLLLQGMMNKEIAHALNLSEKTVKQYMTEVMQKLQARNRVETALMARGWTDHILPPVSPIEAGRELERSCYSAAGK